MMFDHLWLRVDNRTRSRGFRKAAPTPLRAGAALDPDGRDIEAVCDSTGAPERVARRGLRR